MGLAHLSRRNIKKDPDKYSEVGQTTNWKSINMSDAGFNGPIRCLLPVRHGLNKDEVFKIFYLENYLAHQ